LVTCPASMFTIFGVDTGPAQRSPQGAGTTIGGFCNKGVMVIKLLTDFF
jgi:hypothetical protein